MITCDTDEVETQLVPSIPTVGTRLIGRYGKGSLDSTRLERFFVNSENVIWQLLPKQVGNWGQLLFQVTPGCQAANWFHCR